MTGRRWSGFRKDDVVWAKYGPNPFWPGFVTGFVKDQIKIKFFSCPNNLVYKISDTNKVKPFNHSLKDEFLRMGKAADKVLVDQMKKESVPIYKALTIERAYNQALDFIQMNACAFLSDTRHSPKAISIDERKSY